MLTAQNPAEFVEAPSSNVSLCEVEEDQERAIRPFDMALWPLSRTPNEKSRIFLVATVNYPAAGFRLLEFPREESIRVLES